MLSLKRSKSLGELESFKKFIYTESDKYIDEFSQDKIRKILGDSYKNNIILYKFPIDTCKKIKAYSLLENNKTDIIKGLLHKISQGDERKIFAHHMENKVNDLFKRNIDLNALSIISYQLADKFAKKNGDFEVGNLINTELAEFHTYASNVKKKTEGNLGIHIDDETGVSYKTITLIWYIIKDKDIEGGNISFFEGFGEKKVTINIWDKKDDKREKCICLIFKGDIEHSPEAISGRGERSAIVFQFERVDKKDSKTSTAGKITKNTYKKKMSRRMNKKIKKSLKKFSKKHKKK